MELNLFGSRPPPDRAAIERLKQWTAEVLCLPEGSLVLVTELRCAEEDCPDVETVIAILNSPGTIRPFKVFKPLAKVTRDDLAAALTQPGN